MSDKLDRFVNLMKEIFELDKSDLDFGIYRILNIRKKEIDKFLTEGLPKRVQETLAPFASDTGAIEKRIAEIEKQCTDLDIELTASSKLAEEYAALKNQLVSGVDLSALETDVYSALYSFFNRYYDEGDFISKRRYKDGVYAIPYEGEEVKLYWANQDQYYIKTSENFKDYTFKADAFTVHFCLVDATTEQDNNKESKDSKRVFMLYQETEKSPDLHTFEYNEEMNEFIIRFIFDVPEDKKKKQGKYTEENLVAITTYLTKNRKLYALMQALMQNISMDAKKPMMLVEKHLKVYVAKNTFDYFIHKDLKGFLSRELDFYIKSEIVHLDDLDTVNEKQVSSYLGEVKAIKRVGNIIIDFLAQIENFQKKLWLKKKFVISTNWCISLDKIDEKFWPEIILNNEQIQEWIDMYAIDEVEQSVLNKGWTNPPTIEFLKQNTNLLVDTKYYSNSFKDRLLSTIDNLHEKTSGLLIHGDNFHALELLKQGYTNLIGCIYIDPPYNTGPSEILYKNNYKDSSWLSMMHNRIYLAKQLMNDDCGMCVAIDDYAMVRMSEMLSETMPEYERNMIIVNHHPQGTPKENVSRTHEYAAIMLPRGEKIMENAGEIDGVETRAFMRSGSASNNYRSGRPNSFYAVLVDMSNRKIMGVEPPPELGKPYPINKTNEGWERIYPKSKDGSERVWRTSYNSNSLKDKDLNEQIMCSNTGTLYQLVYNKKEPINSNWVDKKYNAGTYGTQVIKNMLGDSSVFSYPKSLYTVEDYIKASTTPDTKYVLDYFAGSGTTGHAIIDLNQQDSGERKYILIEMGNYFDTATKPRIKKAAYATDIKTWENGKPINHSDGSSQIIKYLDLESYEDALTNITLGNESNSMSQLFGDEYLIHYILEFEKKGDGFDVDKFKQPFDYKLKINEHNETKIKTIDLVETFNYLLGLSVVRQGVTTYFKGAINPKADYEGALRLLPDKDGIYGFKQVEGTLPDGQRALVIWRTITDNLIQSNAALDAYFEKNRINPLDREFDVIYVNGDQL